MAFINSAVDANLARSIFCVISEAQKSVYTASSIPFARLELRINRTDRVGEEELDKNFDLVTLAMGRSWICNRDPRDTHREVTNVYETCESVRSREMQKINLDMPWENFWEQFQLGRLYSKAWGELWPESASLGNWFDNWHSFPLAE
jgi:hypothetical protein